MAFIVQCPYCKVRSRAPERALGASGRCTRCANTFTMAPADDQRAPASAKAADADVEPVPEAAVSAAIAEAVEAVPVEEADFAPQPVSRLHRLAGVLGAAALLSAGLALISATIATLAGLVLPLSGVGLLIGLIATGLVCRAAPSRWIVPGLGSAAHAAMGTMALALPGVFGPTFQAARQPAAEIWQPDGMMAIPFNAGDAYRKDVPDWVDASRYALQSNDLRVQVAGVTMTKETLHINLRVQVIGTKGKKLDFAANRTRRPFQREGTLKLTDGAGKSVELREARVIGADSADAKAGSVPVQASDEVLVFAAPPKGWDKLHLEVAAEAWDRPGVFKFSIPAAMAAPLNLGKGAKSDR
ncbi:MAG: hypothetical protein HY289_13125 [Planctomycetes bacterium]|nr:hypothetical protein [Planctomycetota bacterium]